MNAPVQPIISVRNLGKSYAEGPVILENISLNVMPGERLALIGANGAGKSTLLKSLVGLHEINDGAVSAFGETFETRPTNRQKHNIRSRIGFVFQAHGLVKRLSALSNVTHGFMGQPGSWRGFIQATARSDWRIQAMHALNAVNLAEKADSRVDQLSGGQAQRVAIARALVREPELMIADEPAASLDPAAGHEVMRQFSDLARQKGITLVFTSHDMEHALMYADRVVALKEGRIFIDQPSEKLNEGKLAEVFHG